jgi:hypothetical protein
VKLLGPVEQAQPAGKVFDARSVRSSSTRIICGRQSSLLNPTLSLAREPGPVELRTTIAIWETVEAVEEIQAPHWLAQYQQDLFGIALAIAAAQQLAIAREYGGVSPESIRFAFALRKIVLRSQWQA